GLEDLGQDVRRKAQILHFGKVVGHGDRGGDRGDVDEVALGDAVLVGDQAVGAGEVDQVLLEPLLAGARTGRVVLDAGVRRLVVEVVVDDGLVVGVGEARAGGGQLAGKAFAVTGTAT